MFGINIKLKISNIIILSMCSFSFLGQVRSGEKEVAQNDQMRLNMLNEVLQMNVLNFPEKIEKLKEIIILEPDPENQLTQRASELLVEQYIRQAEIMPDQEKRQEYLTQIRVHFLSLTRPYYPDRFNYTLKGNYAYQVMMQFYLWQNDFGQVLRIFQDFLDSGLSVDNGVNVTLNIFTLAVSSNLKQNDLDSVDFLIHEIYKYLDENSYTTEPDKMLSYLWNYRDIVMELSAHKDAANALIFAEIFYKLGRGFLAEIEPAVEAKTFKMNFLNTMRLFSKDYGFLEEETLEILEVEIEQSTGWPPIDLIADKAVILSQIGKQGEAIRYLFEYSKKDYLIRDLPIFFQAKYFNSIAWGFYQVGYVDADVLALIDKSIGISKSAENLDTLACLKATLGEFKEALRIEQEALKQLEIDYSPEFINDKDFYAQVLIPRMEQRRKEYLLKIENWTKLAAADRESENIDKSQ